MGFLRAMAQKSEHGLSQFIDRLFEGTIKTRLQTVQELSDLCFFLMEGYTPQQGEDSKDYSLLVDFAMRDVEELFVDPFGEITTESVVCGFGGKDGLTLLVKDKAHKDTVLSLSQAHDLVVAQLKNESTEKLKILNLTMDGPSHTLRFIDNDRPFTFSDTGKKKRTMH